MLCSGVVEAWSWCWIKESCDERKKGGEKHSKRRLLAFKNAIISACGCDSNVLWVISRWGEVWLQGMQLFCIRSNAIHSNLSRMAKLQLNLMTAEQKHEVKDLLQKEMVIWRTLGCFLPLTSSVFLGFGCLVFIWCLERRGTAGRWSLNNVGISLFC